MDPGPGFHCAAGSVVRGATLLWLPVRDAGAPKNIVLLIGDGMGFEQVKTAEMYGHGAADTFPFEAFPRWVETTRSE